MGTFFKGKSFQSCRDLRCKLLESQILYSILQNFQDGDSLSQSQVALGEDGTLQVISGMDQSETSNQVVLNTGKIPSNFR